MSYITYTITHNIYYELLYMLYVIYNIIKYNTYHICVILNATQYVLYLI